MTTDIQELKSEYTAILCDKVQRLAKKRKDLRISQQIIADSTGFSLRSIQNLESFKTLNPMLIFLYFKILKQYG